MAHRPRRRPCHSCLVRLRGPRPVLLVAVLGAVAFVTGNLLAFVAAPALANMSSWQLPRIGRTLGKAMAGDPAKGAKIWILTWGSRGDHEPIAALALGLREKGHKVGIFGKSRMKRMFLSQGLDFRALDAPPMLHTANKAARASLRSLAEGEGFTGPDKEEVYFFHSVFQKYEYSLKLLRTLYKGGKQGAELLAAVTPIAKAFSDFLVTGKYLDQQAEHRKIGFTFLAEQSGKPLDEYISLAREQCDAFRTFICRVAEDMGWEPLDVMGTFQAAFSTRLRNQLLAIEGQYEKQQKLVEEQVTAFFAWQEKPVAELDAYLSKYWEEWRPQLSLDFQMPVGNDMPEYSAVSVQNMALTAGALPPEELPDVAVTHTLTLSAAKLLQARHGIDVVPWSAAQPPGTLKDLVVQYGLQCNFEGAWDGVPSPVRDAGPLPFVDTMQSTRQLVSMSTLMAGSYSTSREQVKACFTGKWVLDGQASAQGDDGGLFGTAEEKAALEAFLASGEGPPVYLGWGSMAHPGGNRALARLVVKSLRLAGQRGVFVAGGSGLGKETLEEAVAEEYGAGAEGRVLLLASASHEYLFRRCSCTVHHGGAGTTSAALRAGVPTIVSPLLLDQFGNADWVVSLGCGRKTPELGSLTPEALASAITTVLSDEQIQARAKEVAAEMNAELGVAGAVKIVARCLEEKAEPVWSPPSEPRPWQSGTYHSCLGGNRLPIPPSVVRANGIFSPDGQPVGQLRSGQFYIKENNEGIKPGTYNVQAAYPVVGVLTYGNVSTDGKAVTWHDGSSLQWVAP